MLKVCVLAQMAMALDVGRDGIQDRVVHRRSVGLDPGMLRQRDRMRHQLVIGRRHQLRVRPQKSSLMIGNVRDALDELIDGPLLCLAARRFGQADALAMLVLPLQRLGMLQGLMGALKRVGVIGTGRRSRRIRRGWRSRYGLIRNGWSNARFIFSANDHQACLRTPRR